ncbi:uncharacterized protein LOC112128227 [Cimex lectularius]|uniref:Uncharacterized protein n=1 Tax=Cimex lectularius TaxID=79782 RepID=A0A8I6TMY7_CIMLE|nr:uncharacterized protein LOC112128227 [Cimex lectularius]
MIPNFNGEPEALAKVHCKYQFENSGTGGGNVFNSGASSWPEIKNALLTSYSDKRDIYTLVLELSELKQTNESPFQFLEKIQKLLNLQISYLNNVMPDDADTLGEFCRKLGLRILLKGLREPMSSLLQARNPSDLNEALNMLTNDFQHQSTQVSKSFGQVRNTKAYTPRPFRYPQHPPFSSPQKHYPRQNFVFPNERNYQQGNPTPMSISTTHSRSTPQISKNSHLHQITTNEDQNRSPKSKSSLQNYYAQNLKTTLENQSNTRHFLGVNPEGKGLMNLSDSNNRLPHFIDPMTKSKILIDTGSTRSFINPKFAKDNFNTPLIKNQFEVKTVHGISKGSHSIKLNTDTFKGKFLTLELFLFNFHNKFDMLFGLDSMKILNI